MYCTVLYCTLLIVCNSTCTARDVRGYKHLYLQHNSALFLFIWIVRFVTSTYLV